MAMGVHKHGRSGRNRRAPMAEINVTPLVDVMLVLLIIFMVTAPLLTAGVPVDLPDSRANPLNQEQRDPVTVSMDGDGSIYVGENLVDAASLPDRFAAIAADTSGEGSPPAVLLRADRSLDYGAVMQVMGELNRAGLNRVQLVTSGSVESQ